MAELNLPNISILKKLNTPKKIQGFIDSIPINFEKKGETCLSPRMVLEQNKAHCIEGAILAAVILRMQGHRPLIVDMEATKDDDDHVIAVFQQNGYWGAISKTNHAVLRYREPIYRDIRELVMSFFHEYFLNKNGKKTMRAYTEPIDLSRFDHQNWMDSKEEVWYIAEHLVDAPHHKILSRKQIANLARASLVERKLGSIVEWKR